MNDAKDKEELDPVDKARLERESKSGKKGWSSGQKFNFLLLKLIMFIFVVIAMGMCSVKYIS